MARQFGVATAAIASAVAIGRALILSSAISAWSPADVFSAATYASARAQPLLASPFDFLLTAAAAGAFVALAGAVVEGARGRWRARWETDSPLRMGGFVLAQLAAGSVLAALLAAYRALLADTVAHTSLDLLHFSLHPWNAALLALQIGLVLWGAAAAGAATLVLRVASLGWRIARGEWRVRLLLVACWSLPFVVGLKGGPAAVTARSLTGLLVLAIGASLFATRLKGHYRQASQAFRFTLLAIGLYCLRSPSTPPSSTSRGRRRSNWSRRGTARRHSTSGRPSRSLMQQSLREIDGFPGLTDLVSIPPGPPGSEALTDRARSRSGASPASPRTRSRRRSNCSVLTAASSAGLRSTCLTISTRCRPRKSASARGTCSKRCHPSSPSNAACSAPAARSASTIPAAHRVSSARSSCTRCSITRTCRSSRRRVRTSNCFGRSSRSARRRVGRRHRVRRLRMEPHAALLVRRHVRGRLDDADVCAADRRRATPVWATPAARRPAVRRVPAQRSRRHLRARLPGRHARSAT